MSQSKKVFGEVLIKPKKPRVIPISVLMAKRRGDTAELRRLSRIGHYTLAQMRAAQKEQAAKLIAQQEEAELAAQKITAEFLAKQMRQVSLRDARRHAAASRAGWDDHFAPSDEDVIWFN